jgi:hypothetical protein
MAYNMINTQPQTAFGLASSSKSSSEVIAGIVGTIDIGSIIGNAITFATDVARIQEVQGRLHTRIDTILPSNETLLGARVKMTPAQILADAVLNLPVYQKDMIDLTVDSLVQSSGGYKGASAMLGLEAKTKAAFSQADLAASCIFEIPSAIIRMKAARYWNKTVQYGLPDLKTAMILAKNGLWQYTDFGNLLQTENALTDKDAGNITNIAAQQIGKPDLFSAWIMVKKGLWKITDWYLLAQLGHGYTKQDADALFQHFYYTFSPMELFRILDYTDVDDNWLDSKLSMIGLTDADKAIVKAYLLARIAKQQTAALWSLTVYNYSWGLMTDTALTTFLTSNNFSARESGFMLTQAQAQKSKVVFQLMRDAEIYLYRKGVLASPTDLLNGLIALGVSTDVANAITRNEAAKQGINWEIP